MFFGNDSDDWSCAEQTLYSESLEAETENFTALIRTTEAVLVVYHLTVVPVGFTLCSLVIFLVTATKTLQKVSLLLAMKILILDLLYAFLGATSTISSSARVAGFLVHPCALRWLFTCLSLVLCEASLKPSWQQTVSCLYFCSCCLLQSEQEDCYYVPC